MRSINWDIILAKLRRLKEYMAKFKYSFSIPIRGLLQVRVLHIFNDKEKMSYNSKGKCFSMTKKQREINFR